MGDNLGKDVSPSSVSSIVYVSPYVCRGPGSEIVNAWPEISGLVPPLNNSRRRCS